MRKQLVTLVNPPSPVGMTANREGVGGLGNVYPRPNALVYPPQTIAYVAASLRRSGYGVQVVDCVSRAWDGPTAKGVLRNLTSKGTPMVLGVFVAFPTFSQDVGFVRELEESFPGATIIMFGNVLEYLATDAAGRVNKAIVLQGEPEVAVVEACHGARNGTNASRIITPTIGGYAERENDLDSLPLPAWDLCDGDRLWMLSVSASRGCEDQCAYCPYVAAQGRQRRVRAVESVIEELRFLARRFDPEIIVFRDPAFAANRQWVSSLCEGLIRRGLRLRWQCESRPEHFDTELVALIKRAGCEEIKIGVEATDGALLANLRRISQPADAEAYLERTAHIIEDSRRVGLQVRAFVMTGLPDQSASDIAAMRDFVGRVRPSALNVKEFACYPGIGVPTDGGHSGDPRSLQDESRLLHELRGRIEGERIATGERPGVMDRARRKIGRLYWKLTMPRAC